MSSPSAVLLTHSGLFRKYVAYTFRQLYHAVVRITQGYQYMNSEGLIVTDLYLRWKSLQGPGIYEAYQRAAFRMHSLWKSHKGKLEPTKEPHYIELEYREFIQLKIPQCLAYVLDKEIGELVNMVLPARHLAVVFRRVDEVWSLDFLKAVLHQQAEEDRYRVVTLTSGQQAHWNMLGADVMDLIYARAIGRAQETWAQVLSTGRYADVYGRIGTILRKSMVSVLQDRINQGRVDAFGVNVRDAPPTPPNSSGSSSGGSPPSSSSGSDSGSYSGKSFVAGMDYDME